MNSLIYNSILVIKIIIALIILIILYYWFFKRIFKEEPNELIRYQDTKNYKYFQRKKREKLKEKIKWHKTKY